MGKKSKRKNGGYQQRPRRAPHQDRVVPQDHAAKDEALGELVEITYGGHKWVMDPEDFNDYRVLEAASTGNVSPALNALIPDLRIREALLKDLEDHKGRISLERIMRLIDDIASIIRLGN